MILGISAGRPGGNTEALVRAALEECESAGYETKLIGLWDKKIMPCTDCGRCREQDYCWQDDDMNDIQDMLESADAIIIGSPAYFANISARLALMFERSLPLRRRGFKLEGKLGGAIAVGGSRNGGQEHVVAAISRWFTLHGAIAVGDSPPTAHFGGIGWGRAAGDAKDDDIGLETARNLGRHIAGLLMKMGKARQG